MLKMRFLLNHSLRNKFSFAQIFNFSKKYTKDHEWISIENDIVNIIIIIQITVGITEFAQSELGEIVHVELPKVGTKYNEGDSLVRDK